MLGAVAAAALLAQLPATASPQPRFGLWLVRADGTDPREIVEDFVDSPSFAWSPDGAFFAYGNGDIWVLDLATGERRNVSDTFGDGWETEPTWSPDGGRIAYRNGSDLWVRDTDGTDPVQLTEGAATDRLPRWAPAGNLISFVRSDGSGSNERLHVLDPAGGPSVALVEVAGTTSWSPDGREIAYRTPSGGIGVVDVATGATDLVAAEGSFPAWAPSGDRIAFVSGDGLYVVPRQGGAPVQIFDGAANTFGGITWSPDGGRVALGLGSGIGAIDVATGESAHLTGSDGTDHDYSPLWSPAGDLVAYLGVTFCCWSTRWDRSIEAETSRHLVVRGKLDALFPPCVKHVPVSVLGRRNGQWAKLVDVSTGRAGRFRISLPDRPGRYRVVAPRLEVGSEGGLHTCLKTYTVLRHRHGRTR